MSSNKLPLIFFIPGKPTPKGRPRVTRAGHTYTPARTRQWEAKAASIMRASASGPTITGPVEVSVTAKYPRPLRLMRKKDPAWQLYYSGQDDGDNVYKAVCDALEKSGIIANDRQVVLGTFAMYYVAKGSDPGVEIVVEELLEILEEDVS